MAIDLKRFVDVNIQYHESTSVTSTRDTVVLFTTDANAVDDTVYTSYSSFPTAATVAAPYAKTYFANGGVKLLVKKTTAESLASDISALSNDYIVVAFAGDSNFTTMSAIAKTRSDALKDYDPNLDASTESVGYGIDQKILLAYSSDVPTSSLGYANFAVKYSETAGDEMTIAAYLSQIDVDVVDSVRDYMFTLEEVDSAPTLTEANLTSVLNYNYNVDAELAGSIRNLGGNLTDGNDIVNQYMLILLQQTVTEAVVNLLVTKIKGAKGLSAIYSAIAQDLNRYVNCGYLDNSRIWTDKDWAISYNSATYTIIEQGTPLTAGYRITVLPYSSLSDSDRAAHRTPPIYLVLGTGAGIRKVTIGGEVL